MYGAWAFSMTTQNAAPELLVERWFNTDQPLTLAGLRGRVVVIAAFQVLCPNSVSSAAHTPGPLGCSTAALASLSGVESARQLPLLCRDPGGEIWPPRDDIGAGSIAGKR